MANTPGISDTIYKIGTSKVPQNAISTFVVLAAGVAFSTAVPLQNTTSFGRPSTMTVFVSSDTAATITVNISPDGANWFQAGTIALTAASSSAQSFPGASYVQLKTSANITTANVQVQANLI